METIYQRKEGQRGREEKEERTRECDRERECERKVRKNRHLKRATFGMWAESVWTGVLWSSGVLAHSGQLLCSLLAANRSPVQLQCS